VIRILRILAKNVLSTQLGVWKSSNPSFVANVQARNSILKLFSKSLPLLEGFFIGEELGAFRSSDSR
jgi:hypothetical protein